MLQQSDNLPLKFLKTVYVVEADRFMIYNAEKCRTQIHICGMFRSGYLPTARAEKKKVHVFRTTFNPVKFFAHQW
jgi:hypothetical protein